MQWDEAALIAYLEENADRVHLAVRDGSDPQAGLRALRRAASAVQRIPHPDEPEDGLPNFTDVSLEDGLPVLRMDVKDGGRFAAQIATAMLGALETEGTVGRLEPVR